MVFLNLAKNLHLFLAEANAQNRGCVKTLFPLQISTCDWEPLCPLRITMFLDFALEKQQKHRRQLAHKNRDKRQRDGSFVKCHALTNDDICITVSSPSGISAPSLSLCKNKHTKHLNRPDTKWTRAQRRPRFHSEGTWTLCLLIGGGGPVSRSARNMLKTLPTFSYFLPEELSGRECGGCYKDYLMTAELSPNFR